MTSDRVLSGYKQTSNKVLSGYKDLAAFLGVSTKTIQRHLKTIPVSRFGKKIIIIESDLVDWIKSNYKISKRKKNDR